MMSDAVEIECKHSQIKGSWSGDGLKLNFNGALFEEDKNILGVEFSVPFSFIEKYGKQIVLEEIKISVERYIDTDPKYLENA